MRIECPTCSIGFNVSDDQIGQKGLCPKCETKFIIPKDPEDEVEVLAEGKVPEEGEKAAKPSTDKDKSKPRGRGNKELPKAEPDADEGKDKPGKQEKPPGEPKRESLRDSDTKEDAEKERAEGSAEPKAGQGREQKRETSREAAKTRPLDDEDEEFDAGGAGKALGLLALGLVLGLAIGFALGRLTAGGEGDEDGGGIEAQGDTKDPFGLGDGN